METRLTTDQKIPGSTPGRLVSFLSVIGETEQEKKKERRKKRHIEMALQFSGKIPVQGTGGPGSIPGRALIFSFFLVKNKKLFFLSFFCFCFVVVMAHNTHATHQKQGAEVRLFLFKKM